MSSTAPCPAQVYDVTVRNSVVRSEKCNALQIGSETVGNMSKISFSNISILGAAKAGIGIVSMDGSHVRDVTYDAIRMTDVQAVAFVMLGARLRRPYIPKLTQVVDEWIGSISDVVVRGVTATRVGAPNRWKGYAFNYSTHVDGLGAVTWSSGSKRDVPSYTTMRAHYLGPRIVFADADIQIYGKGTAAMTQWSPAHNPKSYVNRNVGPSPAYAAFSRLVDGVVFRDWTVSSLHNDDRPAFVFDNTRGAHVARVDVPRGQNAKFDVGLRNDARVTVARKHGHRHPLTVAEEGDFETPQHIKVPKKATGLVLPPYAFD